MQLADLQAIAQGVPSIYRGYEKMNIDDVTGSFEISGKISVLVKPQVRKNPETKKWETVVNQETQKPYIDKVVFLPLLYNGQKVIVATTSYYIIQLIEAMENEGEMAGDRENQKIVIKEDTIEGKLKFGKKPYEYGSKGTKPIPTLQNA